MAITTNITGPIWTGDNFQYDPQRQISNQGSTILRNIQGDINELRHEMEKLKGFYEWMIHAYPETIAQYKALMDLQRASNQEEGVAQQKSAAYERYAR